MYFRASTCAVLCSLALIVFSDAANAQTARNRYALILEDSPVSTRFGTRGTARGAEAQTYRQQVETRQQGLKGELRSRNVQITGSVSTVQNAVFVAAPTDRINELKSLAGVKAVIPLRRYERKLNRATQIVNASAAWTTLGGITNAGAGIKIGILDTGIDQNHPSFIDSSLQMPAGYPRCDGNDCVFTNSKVIAARSYVKRLAGGSGPDPSVNSHPDDYSPRDRIGHGTAVASVAAGTTTNGLVQYSGVAPKAYLGNYKIYGSPQVNDFTTDDVIIQALEDAFNDGMDIVNLSSGGPAFTGPLETGAACGNPDGVPCDLVASVCETLTQQGLVVIVSAGNEGNDGFFRSIAYSSISSPATAPSVIAVGATTNSHFFQQILTVPGNGVPSNLQAMTVRSGDAFVPPGAVSAPMRDVAATGDDGYACSALPAQSMTGTIALIQRGPIGNACEFFVKMTNAVTAGAIGVVFYNYDASPSGGPGGASSFSEPAVMISSADGVALKDFIAINPNHPVSIESNGVEIDASSDDVVSFSSRGPAAGNGGLKPDVVSVGTDMYMASQSYDPLGDMFSSNGFVSAAGTSFSAPMIAGAAALIRQRSPQYTPAQIKSAFVNTASQSVMTDEFGRMVDVRSVGGGRLDLGAAIGSTVTIAPATLSFGIATSLPQTQQLQITNTGSAAVSLTLAVVPVVTSGSAAVTLDKQSLSLAPGEAGSISASLTGTTPAPGAYSGTVTIQAPGVALRIPYFFVVGNGVPDEVIPLTGTGFSGAPGSPNFVAFKVVDIYGIPVAGLPVMWSESPGGTAAGDSATDANGVASALLTLGSEPRTYSYVAIVASQRIPYSGTALVAPSSERVLNGASFDTANGIAPGSYVSIFGAGLSDTTNFVRTTILPLAIDSVNVSFDVPSANLSYPGRVIYVSPTQINVQVPWEIKGQSDVQIKVINGVEGNVLSVPLSNYSPAFFEIATNTVAALDTNNQVISSGHPAVRGQAIQLFANGLGPVSNEPATGDPAPSSPLSRTTSDPAVTIGGQQAAVSFSGLAPGFAGLYQINVTVPTGLAPGTYPIVMTIGGKTSNTSGITVQ